MYPWESKQIGYLRFLIHCFLRKYYIQHLLLFFFKKYIFSHSVSHRNPLVHLAADHLPEKIGFCCSAQAHQKGSCRLSELSHAAQRSDPPGSAITALHWWWSAERTQPDCPRTLCMPTVTCKPTNTVWKSVVLSMHPPTAFLLLSLRYNHSALDFSQLKNGDYDNFRELCFSQESNVWSILRSSAGNSHRK